MSGIGADGEHVERLYTASLYYIRQTVSNWEVHLVVTQDTETHNTVVREYYESIYINAVEGPHIPIVFERESIELDIPMVGIDVNGWRIKPVMNPAISKAQVDYIGLRKRIPFIPMTVKYQLPIPQGGTPPDLSYLLSIKGTTEPNNKISIDINFSKEKMSTDSSVNPSTTSEVSTASTEPLPLSFPTDLSLVYETLYPARPNWYNLGLALNLLPSTLESIKIDNRENPGDCLRDILLTRMKKIPRLTWRDIIEVLRQHFVGMNDLALRIERRYYHHGAKHGGSEGDQPQTMSATGDVPTDKNQQKQTGESVIPSPKPTPVFFASKFWQLDRDSIQNNAGHSVLIAVLDTGVNPNHAALQGKVKYGRNFVTEDYNTANFFETDLNSHGTAVAGVLAGRHLIADNYPVIKEKYTGFDNTLPLGVASQASLVICRIGSSHPISSYVTTALKWIWEHNCVVMDIEPSIKEAHLKECELNHENREENVIRIVSMSFKLADGIGEIKSYIDKLNTQSVICVAGAGNDGNNRDVGWPARYENVLSVGSVDKYGELSTFSSRPFDVCTLGQDVLVAKNAGGSQSVRESSSNVGTTSDMFEPTSGTEFAASAVAGLVAILVQCAREQGEQALAEKITDLKVLRQLFKKYLLSSDSVQLLRPQFVEAFFTNEIQNLVAVVLSFDPDFQLPSSPTSLSVSRSGEQHKYLKQLEELKKDKGTIDVRYLKLYFIGLSGIGKTTFRERFTRQLVNISSSPPEKRQRHSTHLAECTQVLAVTSGSKVELDLSKNPDEAQTIFNYLYGLKSRDIDQFMSDDSNADASDGSSVHLQSSSSASEKTSDDQLKSSDATSQLGTTTTKHTSETSTSSTVSTRSPVRPRVNIKKIFDRLYEVVGSGKYAEELLDKILLNLIDMGGQPGFLEMLPFLSTGPGMYLVFLPLDKELDQQYEVTYERGGDRITPYKTTYTVRDTISQILSSVSHHTTCDPTAERMLRDKFPEFRTVQPIATLVGTFKDKFDLNVKKTKLQEELRKQFHSESEEVLGMEIERILHSSSEEQGAEDIPKMEISESTIVNLENAISQHLASETFKREVELRIDEELHKIHVALEKLTSCFGHVIANPVSDKHRFFAVDNFGGTDDDLDPIRQHLHSVFEQKFEKAKVPIRPAQLLFGIILRKEFDIVTKDECFQIGRELGMAEKDVEFTIWYLHHCVGALIHYPDIEDEKDSKKSWFKDNIICSPQVVFDSISNLIVKSLLELHSDSGNIAFVEMERNNWLKKGQFSLETIECCQSKEIKKDVEEGKLIPVQKLIKLLQHVHLLSPIKTKRTVGHNEETDTLYFMPAILECASSKELLTPTPSCDDSPAPILLTFECGYVPIGLFCAMIARLVSKGSDGILGLKWKLDESCVKRNIVSFFVSDCYHTTLISHVNCYEIRVTNVSKTTKSQSKLPDICTYVLTTVQFILKEISALVRLTIAFDCPCEQHQSDKRNWCKLCEGAITGFRCENRDVLLTRSQLYWFAKEVQSGKNVHLQALPFAKRKTEGEFSFSWLQQPSCSNELIIKSDSPDCIGYYTCEVRKDKSDDDPYFTVHRCLFAPISITQSPPERQEAGEGETVSLTVTATGTDPTYQWLKDNKPLTDNDSYQGLDEHTLVIRKATTDLSGSYSCRVSNNISEEDSRPANLIIGNPHIKRLIHKRPNDDFEKKSARISQSEESKPEHEDEYVCCSENEDNCSSENKHTIWWGQTSVSTATGLMGAVSGASESPPLMQFCTEQTREDDVPQEQQQLASDDRAYGSIRTDKMWDLTRFRELKIHFLNPDILTDPKKPWSVSVDTILAWATCTWNTPTSVYPKLRDITAAKDEAQIRVKFDVSQRCWSKVGKDALTVVNKDEPTMVLNLYGLGNAEQKSYVIHEFGHALGLDHEHQRSDFWDVLGEKDGNGHCRFIIGESEMKSGNHNQCQKACSEHFKAQWATTKSEQSVYDPESIMHYWFDKDWLLPQYRDLNYVRNKTDGILNDLQRKVIEGVHERDYSNGILVEQPSRLDYEVLNNAYKTKSGAKKIP